ncbi:MAG: biopolymer transporter ExbD [Pirellulales bacterium]
MADKPSMFRERLDDGPLLARRPMSTDNNLDITPMIDVTFLLLIFFLVAAVPEVQAALDLPSAQHGISVSRHKAAIITVAAGSGSGGVRIVIGEGGAASPLAGSQESQETQIRAAVVAAKAAGKTEVIIKADRRVLHRDVARVMRAAGIEGMKVNLAVSDPR